MAVATENPIRLEMTCEAANHVIIPQHAGARRAAVALAGIAAELATAASGREPPSAPPVEHSAPTSTTELVAAHCRSAGVRLALSPLPGRGGCRRDRQTRDGNPLASTRVQSLLAVEVAVQRWQAGD